MNLFRAFPSICRFLALGVMLGGVSCGSFRAEGGIPAQALILVVDAAGNPVPGATVWVPADVDGTVGTDTSGSMCAPAPAPVLFASCTGEDGIALLECADGAIFLFRYAKDGLEGSVNGECGDGKILLAPFS